MTELPIAGLRAEPADARPDPDPPLGLVGRFASSAGHVMGRPLISSETLTWLRENFRETPAAAKPQIDRLFVAGINHIFYHGVTYSPSDVPWPGWFFYAATQLGPGQPAVGALRVDERVRRARAIRPAVGPARQRHPALLAIRRTDRSGVRADEPVRRARDRLAHGVRRSPAPRNACCRPATRSTSSPTRSSPV